MVSLSITNKRKGMIKMSNTKSKYNVAVAISEKGRKIYLSERDIEQGIDSQLDMQGYTIEAL